MEDFKNKNTNIFQRLLATLLVLLMLLPEGMEVYAASAYKPEVGKYGMTPIYGRDIADGTYTIQVDSSSAFFKVIHAEITVSGDEITGSITIGSHSYPSVYLGTKEEAAEAPESDHIPYTEDGDYAIFTFPVEALNTPIHCAAYSKRKKRWYDRRILFDATTLPEGALLIDLPDFDMIAEGIKALEAAEGALPGDAPSGGDYGSTMGDAFTSLEAMEVPYEDGEYSIEVSMTGGTGRAAVSSPTLMIVKDGRAYAKLLWSSSHYDWMVLGGETFYNANTDGGNSYFIVPIPDMDRIIEIVADTTAMGDPVAIHYSITFYADTIGNKGLIPQEAAKKVIILAAIITVVGGILNYFVKKRKKK